MSTSPPTGDLRVVLEDLTQRSAAAFPKLAAELAGLRDALFVSVPALCRLPEDDAAEYLAQHRGVLDYCLLVEPARDGSVLGLMAKSNTDAAELARRLRVAQQEALSALQARGIERIPVVAGAPFVHGEIDPSSEEPVPTHSPERDGRVASVAPGNGGWRVGSHIAVPARARAYAYAPSSLAKR